MSTPVISIGMPVYNGEKYIRAAIECMLAQSWKDFELTISDNASTDNTEQICRKYASLDSRILYIRQPTNLGASGNFRFVLLNAKAEYFMWAAVDDLRSPDFLEANLTFLREHPEYLGSTSPVSFSGGQHNFDARRMGDAALDNDDPIERIIQPFSIWHANGHFYGLFRRSTLMDWKHIEKMEFLGADWTLITHLASKGKLHRHSQGWAELGLDGASNSNNIFASLRNRWIEWILPFYVVTLDTMCHLKSATFHQRKIALLRLLRLNFQAVAMQVQNKRRAIRVQRKALQARIKSIFSKRDLNP